MTVKMALIFAKMEPIALMHLVKPVLFALVLPSLLVASQTCSSSYSQSNFKLVGHTVKTLSSSSSDACLSECSSETNCSSINFNGNSKQCELNKANHLSHPESLTPCLGSGWLYVNNRQRPPASCSDKLCSGKKLCFLKNDGEGESYDCSECEDPLGMEDGRIPDSSILASRIQNDTVYNGRYGRLRSTNWTIENGAGEFHIDLGRATFITMVATQGCDWGSKRGFVREYVLAHSTDNTTWVDVYNTNGTNILIGNTDESTTVINSLQPKIKARFVLFSPREWQEELSLRVELYGCTIP